MKKRMFIMLAFVIVFIGAIGGFKYFQIRAMMSQSWTPPPEAVTTAMAKPAQWDQSIAAIGSVAAVNGVTVSADLPGVIREMNIESGRNVSKGDILIRLDTREEQAQLVAAEAQRDLARLALQRSQGLAAKGIVAQADFDQAQAEFKANEAKVGEISATIQRKTIHAPFSGVLGIRQVNVGQYVAGGAPLVTLEAVRPVYVNFSVPQQVLSLLRPGTTVNVSSDAIGGAETGRVSAVDSVVDETTRNAHVQATFDNTSGRLKPGMYVDVALSQGGKMDVIEVPTSSVSYAPFGDSVFIVEDMKGPDGKSYRGVRQQFVKLGGARGDQVAILTGLKPGEEVVTSGVFKLRPGAAVLVNNNVQPGNNPKPHPENT